MKKYNFRFFLKAGNFFYCNSPNDWKMRNKLIMKKNYYKEENTAIQRAGGYS